MPPDSLEALHASYDSKQSSVSVWGGEDTGISLEDIRQGFGKWVADIVAGCSEPDKTLSWEARKEHTIKFLTTASHDIKYVSCADKLHNLSTIAEDLVLHGPAMWDRFNRGRDQQAWYYRGVRDALGNGSFESVPISISQPWLARSSVKGSI